MMHDGWVSKIPIEKGWSQDQKYRVTDNQGNCFLLRVSPMAQYAHRQRTYELQLQAASLGVPMCRPVAFGVCDEGVYVLQTWIDGTDAEDSLPQLPSEAQYAYGQEAGRILRILHQIPAPPNLEDWSIRFNRKIDRKLTLYADCPLRYAHGQAFIDFIQTHRGLLAGRPQTYQHGDYHLGNMMLDRNGRLIIIDFDRDDFGDPWEELNRIVWCAQASPLFATGMVNGYFADQVPQDFWKLLALYISTNTLSALPWAIPFGEKEVQVMRQQAADVLRWYHQMTQEVPSWYMGSHPL